MPKTISEQVVLLLVLCVCWFDMMFAAALSCDRITLRTFLTSSTSRVPADVVSVIEAVACSSIQIAEKIARAPIDGTTGLVVGEENASGDKVKKLDEISNEIMKQSLIPLESVSILVSEEENDPIITTHATMGNKLIVTFDPLDGSSNLDCAVATGTICGIYRQPLLEEGTVDTTALTSVEIAKQQALQRGNALIASMYVMYSSSTEMMLCTGWNQGVHGFTLDPTSKSFVLTRKDVICPSRGPYYSLNEGRSADWPEGLQNYIQNIKNGKGTWGKRYSSRYICSLVADFHRTLLYGGWAGNPRSHLRLLYEAAPLGMIAMEAKGKGSDGIENLIDLLPSHLHHKTPVFLGSMEDIKELESFENVQQLGNIKYEA